MNIIVLSTVYFIYEITIGHFKSHDNSCFATVFFIKPYYMVLVKQLLYYYTSNNLQYCFMIFID